MESYSNAALADQLRYIRKRQDRQNEKMMMIQSAHNEVVELVNIIAKFLDGHSITKKTIVLTFAGKKLEYLELTDGELGETR